MFFQMIRDRRSVRKYRSEPIAPEMVAQLMEAALRAPSSRGFNPWEFIVITDTQVLNELSRAKPHGAAFLKNAPLGIVICADPQKSDVWVEDASIAAIYLHLAATSLGLGSCWIQMRKRMHAESKAAEAFIADLLGIPSHLRVLAVMAVGHGDEKKVPHGREYLQFDKIHLERFGLPWQASATGKDA